eukprot:5508273-Prymnesium_polylepis.1
MTNVVHWVQPRPGGLAARDRYRLRFPQEHNERCYRWHNGAVGQERRAKPSAVSNGAAQDGQEQHGDRGVCSLAQRRLQRRRFTHPEGENQAT